MGVCMTTEEQTSKGADEVQVEFERPAVAIAGASGFIGRALMRRLAATHRLIGLTRSPWKAGERVPDLEVSWRGCDLFSLSDAEKGLEGADLAFYLVHSMLPQARLTQANFADLDLIMADNFAKAAARAGVRHIVYLGGILPRGEALSKHLKSRKEVEDVFKAGSVPVTALRAGLIVGAEGSSFRIMQRLVQRLPAMLLPSWTSTPTTPVALDDAVEVMARVLDDDRFFDVHGDLGGPEDMTYAQMMLETAEALGSRRRMVTVPVLTPRLSALWVSVVTQTELELVAPLVQSLECEMLASNKHIQEAVGVPGRPFRQAVDEAVAAQRARGVWEAPSSIRRASDAVGRFVRGEGVFRAPPSRPPKDVRSVQRLPLPEGMDAMDVAAEYARWLPRFFYPALSVERPSPGRLDFHVPVLRINLLELTHSEERSSPERALFYVSGGVLADLSHSLRGRLVFRTVLGGHHVLAAIHDFTPSLPWPLYRVSQAPVHLAVMTAFGRHLGQLQSGRGWSGSSGHVDGATSQG